jgi:enoyl-CoA hydratase/carnithine racemase
VFLIGLDRADKLNAFDVQMLRELADAFTKYEDDPALFCAVVYANGASFTAGLDLAEVGPAIQTGQNLFPEGLVDPLGLYGRARTKPVVAAVQGHCLTIGIELILACDIRIASDDTKFGQIEINRGIFPFGGATIRLPEVAGWGNAMRWLLTGDRFDAAEALRIGLVQEVTPAGKQVERAIAIAQTIPRRAPLGVQATIMIARKTLGEGPGPAAAALPSEARRVMATEDAAEGMRSFVERREGNFQGK